MRLSQPVLWTPSAAAEVAGTLRPIGRVFGREAQARDGLQTGRPSAGFGDAARAACLRVVRVPGEPRAAPAGPPGGRASAR